jgi:hypothetical protein
MVRGSYLEPGTIATGRLAPGCAGAGDAACSVRPTRPPHVAAMCRAALAGGADEATVAAVSETTSTIDLTSLSSIVGLLSAHGQRTERRRRA